MAGPNYKSFITCTPITNSVEICETLHRWVIDYRRFDEIVCLHLRLEVRYLFFMNYCCRDD
jgi:hypothetical protein